MIWLASYFDQRIKFITREKGLKWIGGEDGGSEFRDLRPPEGDRMQLPGVSSRCWRPWSMSSGLFALNMWRRCNSWESPVFVADRAWDLATFLWHIITQSKWETWFIFLVDIGQEKLRRDHIEAFFRKYTYCGNKKATWITYVILIWSTVKIQFCLFFYV